MDRSLRWRLTPTRANGQLAFACYLGKPEDDRFELHALHVLTLDRVGSIAQVTAFLHPLAGLQPEGHRMGLVQADGEVGSSDRLAIGRPAWRRRSIVWLLPGLLPNHSQQAVTGRYGQ